MIGHLVKRVKSGEPIRKRYPKKYLDWQPKTDDKIYKVWSDIPLEDCEICKRKNCATRFRPQYHEDALIYRHHIYLRHVFGDKYNTNTKREYFCMVCGYCHMKIHRILRNDYVRISMEDCLEAIRKVKRQWYEMPDKMDWHGNVWAKQKEKDSPNKTFLEMIMENE